MCKARSSHVLDAVPTEAASHLVRVYIVQLVQIVPAGKFAV